MLACLDEAFRHAIIKNKLQYDASIHAYVHWHACWDSVSLHESGRLNWQCTLSRCLSKRLCSMRSMRGGLCVDGCCSLFDMRVGVAPGVAWHAILCIPPSLPLPLSLSRSLFLSFSRSLFLSFSRSLFLSFSRSLFFSFSLVISFSRSLFLSPLMPSHNLWRQNTVRIYAHIHACIYTHT